MQTDGIDIRVASRGRNSVVHVTGDVTWKTSPGFRTALLAQFEKRDRQRVVLDLHEVHRIDSSGVSILVEAWRAARQARTRLVLSGLNDLPDRVLRLTRLAGLFEIRTARKRRQVQRADCLPTVA